MTAPGADAARTAGTDVVVVGAGIAGLVAARELARAGRHVVVLDKSRGVGGRFATRRVEVAPGVVATFDHGAPCMDAPRDPTVPGHDATVALVQELRSSGVVEDLPDCPATCTVARTGLTAVAKHLADGLDVRRGSRVELLVRDGDRWEVHTEAGPVVAAEAVVLTAPVPQVLDLLGRSGIPLSPAHLGALRHVAYEPCLVALAIIDDPRPGAVTSGVPGHPVHGRGPVARYWDNAARGVSAVAALTVQATGTWSRDHWDDPDATVTQALLDPLGDTLGIRLRAVGLQRWRYATVTTPVDATHLEVAAGPKLTVVGDAFGGRGIASAVASGIAVATSSRSDRGRRRTHGSN